MAKRTVAVGLVQTKVSDDPKANLKKTIEKIREAAKRGAQVICLQELYRTRYFPQDKKKKVSKLAEPIPGESTIALSNLAKELAVVVIVPVFERSRDGKFYNSATVIDANGRIMGTYRKIHIPHDPFFYEKNYFEAGNLGYRVFKTRYINLSVLICYDQWFPEPARISAMKGADIIFYPTAIGYPRKDFYKDENWLDAWQTVQRSHAIANGVYVAAVNRIGKEGEVDFWGSSFICDSFGKVLKRAGSSAEEVLVVDIDPTMNKTIREGWGFFRNRRPDTYKPLLKRGVK